MKKTKLSGRYAKALHDFALEQNREEEVYQDILLLNKVFKENRELRVVIESPIMPADKKDAIFEALFNGKISAISMGFLKLIITKLTPHHHNSPLLFQNVINALSAHVVSIIVHHRIHHNAVAYGTQCSFVSFKRNSLWCFHFNKATNELKLKNEKSYGKTIDKKCNFLNFEMFSHSDEQERSHHGVDENGMRFSTKAKRDQCQHGLTC